MSGKDTAWRGSTMACILGTKGRGANGVWPYTIWYRMQPRLQMSEGLPTCHGTMHVDPQSRPCNACMGPAGSVL